MTSNFCSNCFLPAQENVSELGMFINLSTLSDRRALPWQYFNVIAAWKARRSAPDIFELANFKPSIWYAHKGNRDGSVVDRKVALGG